MAKQKPISRAAARTAAQKKSPARKTTAKSTSRKQIRSKVNAPSPVKARAVRNSESPSAIIATRISNPMACAATRIIATSASPMPATVWRKRM